MTRAKETDEIISHMRRTLMSHDIKVYNPPGLTDDPTENNGEFDVVDPTIPERLRHIDKWDITFDTSLGETEYPMYNWEGIEVRSPVFHDRESADREIAYVLNLIKSTYRVRVNASTGFHVHVGNGTEWLPFGTLRRLGALTWAADPLLSRLHAPDRRVNYYSSSIRYESNLACFGYVPNAHVAAVQPNGGPGDDDEDQPLLAEPDQLIHELLPGWEPEDEQPDDDVNADPFRPWSSLSGDSYANHGVQEWSPMSPGSNGYVTNSDDGEMTPEYTLGGETFEITDDQARWLVDNLPDAETRTTFVEQCIETFGHWDVHLLTGDELYTVIVQCAPGIENNQVILPWSDIFQQWMANVPDEEDDLWHTRPLRLNNLNAAGIIGNFEDMLTRVKQQVGQDGTIEYVRKSTEGETPDSSMRMKGLLRALNNWSRSPDVPSDTSNEPLRIEGDGDDNSSVLTHATGTHSWEFEASDGDYNPPAYQHLLESSPELGSPAGSTASPVQQVTTAVMRMALSSSPSQSPPSSSGSANNSESHLPPRALHVVNIADNDSNNSNSSPFISNPGSGDEEQKSDDGRLSPTASPQQKEQEPERKLRPHDPNRLPASYRNGPYREGAVWERLGWVPTAANRPDPGEAHALDEPGACPGRARLCPEHPSTTAWEGVAAIMAADTPVAVGGLLSNIHFRRLNYNFAKYGPHPYLAAHPEANIRTVEFREAGGTLDGGDASGRARGWGWGWAQVWSRICIGIVDWAGAASAAQFLEVLDRLAEQEDADQRGREMDDAERYDVCDFLEDLGLFAEAAWVRRRERVMGPPS
ncbi:hypothetical protein SLS62_008587 [Diatrype stigma]|uniref:Uncharacterized protein n=1 Tax=Diatrype stigma TaxID=117547 RepID=A0AAN9YLA3_9PEZI